ncbi:MAG: hypothetical protein L0956_09210 [Candidatus Mariimomonas ferrooxydans]
MQNRLKPEEYLSGLAEFILLFIQALLKTGYYIPGHPETEKARESLHAHFKKVASYYPYIKAEEPKIHIGVDS